MKAGLILLAGVLALAGCKGEAKKDAGAGTAQGEVLPGSASDAMLPLDTVKSQAPFAPKSEGAAPGDARGAKSGKVGEKPSAAASEAAVEAKPEAIPSPAQSPETN